jgi:hypothetical protein
LSWEAEQQRLILAAGRRLLAPSDLELLGIELDSRLGAEARKELWLCGFVNTASGAIMPSENICKRGPGRSSRWPSGIFHFSSSPAPGRPAPHETVQPLDPYLRTAQFLFLTSSSPASGRPALHESLFCISVPRWIFLLTFFLVPHRPLADPPCMKRFSACHINFTAVGREVGLSLVRKSPFLSRD